MSTGAGQGSDRDTLDDRETASAFAKSWNALPSGSVYTREQFEEWLHPLAESDVRGREVLELGCGNASLLAHMTAWGPVRYSSFFMYHWAWCRNCVLSPDAYL